MPKRSNEFQRVVYLIKICLANGAVVTESDMLRDRHTGDEREVDTTIRGSVGGDEMVVSVECVGQSRPADVGWVERMVGKHSALPTNLLVLASRSGFSQTALRAAESAGATTVSLDETPQAVEAKLRDRVSGLRMLSYRLAIRNVSMDVVATAGRRNRVSALPDNNVYLEDGSDVGDLASVVKSVLSLRQIAQKVHEWRGKPLAECRTAMIELEPILVRDGVSQELFVYSTAEGALHRVLRIVVEAGLEATNDQIDFSHGRLGDAAIAWGKTKVVEEDCLIAVTTDLEGKMVFALHAGPHEASGCLSDEGTSGDQ